jgi:hypothetical protein
MAQTGNVGWRGDEYSALFREAAAQGLTLGAEYLLGEAIPRTPLMDGPLRESGAVEPATPGDLEAVVSFDTPYARRQHEELDWQHDDGEAKYLERPLEEKADEIQGIIARQIGDIRG